jgi:putative salt-induced outer membrane protein YdiY
MIKVLPVLVIGFCCISAEAQEPTPPQVWTGNFGAGIALTNGNTDTTSVNVSMALVRDPKKVNVLRLNGLYLRGDKESVLIVNQTQFTIRDELNMSPRLFVFGQGNYVKDTFKGIRNLYSPSAGVGYKFINADRMLLGLDNSLGGVSESDIGAPRVTTGAYNAGQRFSWKASKTATITESIASLWKTNNWADSLHNFSSGIALSVTGHSEVKIEFLDTYKTHPPVAGLKRNDKSLITAFVWKL